MPGVVPRCVLPFAEWHVSRWLDHTRTTSRCLLEVPIDVLDRHVHVLSDLVAVRPTERSPLASQHQGALANRELRVTDYTVPLGTQPLGEAEGGAEPRNGLTDVRVDQDRNDRRRRRGAVRHRDFLSIGCAKYQ
jgi:hypothetical protein